MIICFLPDLQYGGQYFPEDRFSGLFDLNVTIGNILDHLVITALPGSRAVPSSHVSLVHRIGPGIQGVRMRCLWEACHRPLARRRQMLGIYPTNLLILPSHPPYHWMFSLQLMYLQFPFIVSTRQELLSAMKSQKWCSFLLCPPNFGIVEIYYCW